MFRFRGQARSLAIVSSLLLSTGPVHSDPALAPSSDVADVCSLAKAAPIDRRMYPHADLNAIVWTQGAAEYRATTMSVYHAAVSSLNNLLKDKKAPDPAAFEQKKDAVAAKAPWAVILDVDETLLDNSLYQGRLFEESRGYDARLWDCWSAQRRAGLIEGAAELFAALGKPEATKRGLRAVLITNRSCVPRGGDACPQKAETVDLLNYHLRSSGYVIRPDEVLLKNDPDPVTHKPRWLDDEKTERRAFVAATRRIVMLVGDDLGDFYPKAREMTVEERAAAVVAPTVRDWWGTRWFQLPNPMYGSWERALKNSPGSPERLKHKEVKAFTYSSQQKE